MSDGCRTHPDESTGLDAQGRYAVTEIFIGAGEHESFAEGSLDAAIDALNPIAKGE